MTSRLPQPGELFDARYRIEAVIGRGGFGCVYRAHDDKLRRPIALKVLFAEAGADDQLLRFRREAELSRGLVHPHTVRVYDYGLEPHALPYIAFELLDGESLHRRLSRAGKLSVADTRRIAGSVLKSLMEAHALGIVHRDIKPANIFLCNFAGATDFVKVLDFGIAKAPKQNDLTQQGWLIGTPVYMAPEQIAGRELSPRADLYSLGLLMVTMLTGSPLLGGTTHEIIAQQVSDEPLALPREVVASPLFGVIRRATEKDPARRYQSAAEMLADIEGELRALPTLADEVPPTRASTPASVSPVAFPVVPTPPPAPMRARGPSLRWPIAVGLALMLLFLLAATATVAYATRPTQGRLEPTLALVDPSASPTLIELRAERAGFVLGAERKLSETVLERHFSHPSALGVMRFEALPSLQAARRAELVAGQDRTRSSIRRGRRVVSVWAAPRGQAHFDRELAARLLGSLAPAQRISDNL